jgi:hypothetical protein
MIFKDGTLRLFIPETLVVVHAYGENVPGRPSLYGNIVDFFGTWEQRYLGRHPEFKNRVPAHVVPGLGHIAASYLLQELRSESPLRRSEAVTENIALGRTPATSAELFGVVLRQIETQYQDDPDVTAHDRVTTARGNPEVLNVINAPFVSKPPLEMLPNHKDLLLGMMHALANELNQPLT